MYSSFFRVLSLFIVCVASLCMYFVSTPAYAAGTWLYGNGTDVAQPYCTENSCTIKAWVDAVKTWVPSLVTDKGIATYAQDIVIYLLGFLALISVIYIIYAGFQILIGAGDDEKVKKAKNIILYVGLGLIVIALAYPIVTFIFGIVNSRPSTAFHLVPTALAYTENDADTFDAYKKQLEAQGQILETEYRVNNKVAPASLQATRVMIQNAVDTLPDNPDYQAINESAWRAIDLNMQLAEKSPASATNISNLISAIRTFTTSVKIDRIQASISANPASGNAPLSVTFQATGVRDPSGTTPRASNYIWWMRGATGRIELWRGPTLNYIFTTEQTYTVYLDIVSDHKNKKWKTATLPFSESKQIEVLPRIGNVYMLINGVNVTDMSSIKITPTLANLGIIFDATASRANVWGTISKTTWKFGNDNDTSYAGVPQVERQIFANDGNYVVSLELTNNQGQTFKKDITLIVRDPAAVIQTDRTSGYIGDDIAFSAVSYFTSAGSSSVVYKWDIVDEAGTKKLYTWEGTTARYKFLSIGTYIVTLTTRSANGKTDVDSKTITIESRDPMISVEVSRPSSEKPNQILLDASRSYDTDINADTGLVYSWKIDNTDVALEKSKENGAIGYHTFSTVGVHTVSLSLTNAYGKTKTITKDITIDSILSIDMDISPRAAPLGSIVAFDAVSPGAYFYTWKYGDGESSAGTQSSSRHIYKKSGIYDMSVSVTDQDGKTSNTLTRKVYVTNVDEPFAIFDIRKDGNIVEPISGICDAGDAFLADRAGSMTIDGSSSVNIDGTRNNLSYTWKYQGEYQSGPTFSKKFEDIGCFPVTLTVKSNQNGAVHTTTRYIAVKNLLPKLSNISIQKDDTKKDNQKIIVTATANNARDADGVITSYMWYYTTESDPEPQDIKILQKNSATFVLPNITEKYFFGVILEDNDGAKMNSIDTITEKIPFITANEETSIYLPLISVSASSNKVKVGDTITYIASAKTLIWKPLGADVEYAWDYDGDGKIDKKWTESTTTYTYTKAGTYNVKIKVTNNGISNSKYMNIVVKNELVPRASIYRIGSRIYMVNTSDGVYTSTKWKVGDFSSESMSSASYNFADSPVPATGTLEISDGTITQSTSLDIASVRISEKSASASGDISIVSTPEISAGVITVPTASTPVSISLFENDGNRYEIDTNISVDSNTNGTPDDDIDNKDATSYTDGSPYVLPDIRTSKTKERTARISIYKNNVLVGKKDIRIVLAWVSGSTDTTLSASGSIGTGSVSRAMSATDIARLDTIAAKLRTFPQDTRVEVMKRYNDLIENWDDSFERTKILIDLQQYVDSSSISAGEKSSLGSLFDIMLAWDAASSNEMHVSAKLIQGLIPPTHPQYQKFFDNIESIKWHPGDTTENKKLANELVEILKTDTIMEDKYKKIIYSQLSIIIGGGSTAIAATSTGTTPVGDTSNTGFVGSIFAFLGSFVWILMYILLAVCGILLLGYIAYRVVNKNPSVGFQDFIIDSIFHKNANLPTSSTLVVPVVTPVVSTVVDTASTVSPPISTSIPDWLKVSGATTAVVDTDPLADTTLIVDPLADISLNTTGDTDISPDGELRQNTYDTVANVGESDSSEPKTEDISPLYIPDSPTDTSLDSDDTSIILTDTIVDTATDIPDWLKEDTVSPPSIDTVPMIDTTDVDTVSPPDDQNLPDWLKMWSPDIVPTITDTPVPTIETLSPDEVDDVDDIDETNTPSDTLSVPTAAKKRKRKRSRSKKPSTVSTTTSPTENRDTSIPADEMRVSTKQPVQASMSVDIPVSVPTPSTDLPDWLTDSISASSVPISRPSVSTTKKQKNTTTVDSLPDWLK